MADPIVSTTARWYQSGGTRRKSEIEWLRIQLDLLNRSMEEADKRIDRDDNVKMNASRMREVVNLINCVMDEYDFMTVNQRGYLRKVGALIGKLTGRDNLGRNIGNIKALLVHIRAKGGQNEPISRERLSSAVVNRRPPFISEQKELIGAGTAKDLMNNVLLGGESRRSAVVVLGMAGIGKTFLAERIYNSDAVAEHFEFRAWIVDEGFTADEILKLAGSVMESLRGRRYLIVFEDVRTVELWGVARDFLPDDGVGSRVMITTRSKDVAASFIEHSSDQIHMVKPLTEDESWELFCRTAFEGRCPEELHRASVEIVKSCGGWPLKTHAMGSLLSKRPKVPEEWQRVLDTREDFPKFNMSSSINNLVSLSFNYLPPHLKKCFLYFSVFKENSLIHNEKLIRLWIAEGFIQEMQGKTPEDVADEYLQELVRRNLVTVCAGYGIDKFCCTHEVIHMILQEKAANRDFCMVDKGRYGRVKISSADTLRQSLKTVQRSWVRSVFLWDTGPLNGSVLIRLFKKFKLTTILDMEDSALEVLPKEVGDLSYLKYLSLKNTGVRKLPDAIGALNKLEVFDLSGSLLVELPTVIAKLGSLRHLLASHKRVDGASVDSAKGVKIKNGIGALVNLQTLTTVDAKLSGINILQEMKNLKQLRSLRVSRLTSNLADALCACISEMANLKSLHIESMKNESLHLQNVVAPPAQLECLILKGELQGVPDWISHLRILRTMCLSLSIPVDDPLHKLCLLPNLGSLWLYGASKDSRLDFNGGFVKLKLLVLREMWKLETVEIADGTMPLLEELRIGPSPLLREVPAGIARLSSLKVLSFYDMPDRFVLRIQPDKRLEFPKIKHVASVLFCYINPDGRSYISYKIGEQDLLTRLSTGCLDVDTYSERVQYSRLSFSHGNDEGYTDSATNFRWENTGSSNFTSDQLSSFIRDSIEDA